MHITHHTQPVTHARRAPWLCPQGRLLSQHTHPSLRVPFFPSAVLVSLCPHQGGELPVEQSPPKQNCCCPATGFRPAFPRALSSLSALHAEAPKGGLPSGHYRHTAEPLPVHASQTRADILCSQRKPATYMGAWCTEGQAEVAGPVPRVPSVQRDKWRRQGRCPGEA